MEAEEQNALLFCSSSATNRLFARVAAGVDCLALLDSLGREQVREREDDCNIRAVLLEVIVVGERTLPQVGGHILHARGGQDESTMRWSLNERDAIGVQADELDLPPQAGASDGEILIRDVCGGSHVFTFAGTVLHPTYYR